MAKRRKDPRYDIPAEMHYLGCLLRSEPDDASLGLASVRPSDFYRTTHRRIYMAMGDLVGVGERLDSVTVADQLDKRGDTGNLNLGGEAVIEYLSKLASYEPSDVKIESYARIIRERAKVRALLVACETAIQDARTGAAPDEVYAELAGKLRESEEVTGTSPISLSDALDLADALPQGMLPTGLESLDSAMNGGYPLGGITLIGGDAKTGKTALALSVLRHSCALGAACYIVSRDQLFLHIATRLWSGEAGLPKEQLKKSDEAQQIRQLFKAWPMWFHRGAYDCDAVCGGVRIAAGRLGCKLIVIDFLQRIKVPGEKAEKSHVLVAEALSDVAQDTSTHIVVISRVVKPHEGAKGASQHRFAGEAGVQNAADALLFLTRAHFDVDTVTRDDLPRAVHVLEGRHSGGQIVPLVLEGAIHRWREPSLAEAESFRRIQRAKQTPSQ